ncbi:MAG: TraR/DksA family transcriptional regulator [Acidobacteriaceae bacterium]|nr:TraR/DksA family transcriptional regulator [Acidobacteriaceae bacterium]
MDVDHYRQLLLAKEKQLVADMSQLHAGTLEQDDPGAQDEMDRVVQSESKDLLSDLKSQEYDLLQDVRAALRRMDDGTYGSCAKCGKPIDPKRLEAVPWAEYDVQHQPDNHTPSST